MIRMMRTTVAAMGLGCDCSRYPLAVAAMVRDFQRRKPADCYAIPCLEPVDNLSPLASAVRHTHAS